jgi:hypothetical protein
MSNNPHLVYSRKYYPRKILRLIFNVLTFLKLIS